jgi:CoA:oxalate CoA-transferase
LGALLGVDLSGFGDPRSDRDAIKSTLAAALTARTTADWLAVLQPADIWCAEVLDWAALRSSPVWGQLQMERHLSGPGFAMPTIRGPLRLNGQALGTSRLAPALGADTARIRQELAPRKAAQG